MKRNFLFTFLSLVIVSITQAQTYQTGDLFISVAQGMVQWRTPAGAMIDTLQTGYTTSLTLGIAFDENDNLYVVNYEAAKVSQFNNMGVLQGIFGSGLIFPESIVYDSVGNVYVSNVLGHYISKFDGAGNSIDEYYNDRVDWMDLDVNQCTMLFTQEGQSIKRYDVCADTLMTDFATNLGGSAYALRLMSTGEVMLANRDSIMRFSPVGQFIQSYDAPSENCWFAINLSPDGTTFWSADYCSSNVYQFDLSSGAVLNSFNSGTATSTVFGLAVFGEFTAGTGINESTTVQSELYAYPNPGNGLFSIMLKEPNQSLAEAEVYNALGEKILNTNFYSERTVIDITGKPQGIYFLKITVDRRQYVARLIILD